MARCNLRKEDGSWKLIVTSIRSAADLPGGGLSPDLATAAIQEELLKVAQTEEEVIVGVDSPPSIARQFISEKDWVKWAAKFSQRYPSPAALRKATSVPKKRKANSCVEPKRVTDVKHKTPLAPQNLRMYKQTWWAIAHLYGPLTRKGFCLVPCMPRGTHRHLIMESCPASLLKRLDLYAKPYKGREMKHRSRRRFIMNSIKMLGLAG